MSNENVFLKKAFASGKLFTGFLEDPPDPRDYKFSDIMKKQGVLKTVKKKVKKLVNQKRGSYRKAGHGKILKNVTVLEDVPTEIFYSASPLKVDHSVNMSSVKNQGDRGTCVAFAAAALKEIQEKTEHEREIEEGKFGKSGKVYNYSEQWLYQNCKKIDGYNGEGTHPRAVMKVLNKIGVPTESAWPYTDAGIDVGKPKFWAELIARWAVIGSYWRVNSLMELKAALVDSPVIIGGPLFIEWAMPVRGVIEYPADPSSRRYGAHAVCAVGYDDEKQQIKIKNSWSKYWGDRGYGYLPYRYIDDFNWGGWAARDISVTKEMLKGPGEELTPLVW
jgi:C1A family cysteine protease